MNLVKWKDNKIIIAPEAYGIKAFKDLWDRDESADKERAITELNMIYFLHDPRSEFMHEVNEDDRLEKIKEEMGISENWTPDILFNKAVKSYLYLVITTSSKILESNRKLVEKTRETLDNFSLENIDDEKKPAVIASIYSSVKISTDLMVTISKAEKTVALDVEEHSAKMRGKGVSTIGDEGLNSIIFEDDFDNNDKTPWE